MAMSSNILAVYLAAAGSLFAAATFTTPPAFAGTEADQTKMQEVNTLTGRTFEYAVAGYEIRVEFLAEDRLRWTYIAAPDGQEGKTSEETLDRRDIHYGIVLLAWTEADGSNVVDIFDLQTMTLHANAVMPDGQRFFITSAITEID